jgi:hypothetical protein
MRKIPLASKIPVANKVLTASILLNDDWIFKKWFN